MHEIDVEPLLHDYFPHGFVISSRAWHRFSLDTVEAEAAGVGASRRVRVARGLANHINAQRDFRRPDVAPAHAGEIHGLGLLTDVFRHIILRYAAQDNPGALVKGPAWVREQAGPEVAERPLPAFCGLYPPTKVRVGETSQDRYLDEHAGTFSHRELVVRELLLLHLSMINPAARPYRDLFDDTELRQSAPYPAFVEALTTWLRGQDDFGDSGMSLIDFLLAPLMAAPQSLLAQLEYVRVRWRHWLPEALLEQVMVAQGVLQEAQRMRGLGPGPSEALTFRAGQAGYDEPEAFSIDREWMPNLVLLAKTVYVWLDQLSRAYGRPIHRLDQVPDEELDTLGRRGFTGLWLIGLWERSDASRAIKVRMGNAEAAASAYSLYDYAIAHDLGGYDSYQNLAQRAWRRGIRLASDMVPNHVGIYSKWVIEHPHWFVQLDHSPFPGYTFNGPNLSSDPGVGLYIEDGYWNHSDAAVVFKRVDHGSGHTTYLYHGNDGTSMPWNDTAQLNYLLPEVREAVIQTILHVARLFPIIRFDAAMTLAKKHFQRLWFPLPGDGGAIPTRAEHSMTREAFDHVFPLEFWREVVDRVAQEAPDTLLLAEAFWLMEGYFVRTLGMHRVYNSAFMNMLKMEDNAKYRETIKNVLAFSPEILQRFVNFMNNPDEDTAEAQFGKGDKYFGVCTLLSTMPGLPMFGHGQVEGYTEKYGMEYRRAYKNETPEGWLVDRHEAEIFPLLHRRHIFSGARHFAFYDFITDGGWVDENVYAYSNRSGRDRALVVFNNVFGNTQGRVQRSCDFNEGPADSPRLKQVSIAEALTLNTAATCYYIYRDHRHGLEYLEHAGRIAEQGLPLSLGAYQYQVLLDWREVHDFDNSWGRLHAELKGRGVPSVEEAYHEMHLAEVLAPFRTLIDPALLRALSDPAAAGYEETRAAFRLALDAFLRAAATHIGAVVDFDAIVARVDADLNQFGDLKTLVTGLDPYPAVLAVLLPLCVPRAIVAEASLTETAEAAPVAVAVAPAVQVRWLIWAVLRQVGTLAPAPRRGAPVPDPMKTAGGWMRTWYLIKPLAASLGVLEQDAMRGSLEASLIRVCLVHADLLTKLQTEVWAPLLDTFLHDPDVAHYLRVHPFGGRRWLNKEQWEGLLDALLLASTLARSAEGPAAADDMALAFENAKALKEAAADCGYDMDATFDCLK
jgi:glycosidase